MGFGEWAISAVLVVGAIVWLIERAELKRRGLR